MKLSRIFLLGLLISTVILKAQTDFRPGYIISKTGDTLLGKIDYRGDLIMSQICKFKNADNTIYEYTPSDVIAFRFIDSKYYVSRQLNHNKVFLEYLIKGKVNIYYMRDNRGDHYYLEKEGIKIMEMPYEAGIKFIDHKRVFYESKRHIGLLNVYMQDAPEFQSRIQSVKKPEHKNLIKLAQDYHNAVCDDEECIIYEKRLPPIKVSITPFVGLIKYNEYDKFINILGGYIYLWAPRASEKLFLKTGLVYHRLIDDGVKLNAYKIPIQFLYSYRAHRIQPNISGGFNFINIKHDDYRVFEQTLSINLGLDYKISDDINLSAGFNSDLTPIGMIIMNKFSKFDIISYSIDVGLRIDL